MGSLNQENKQIIVSNELTSALAFFWLWLAIAFGLMSIFTYETRKHVRDLMRGMTYEWVDKGSPFHAEHRPSATRLETIFNHMLKLELLAFLLTAVSAFVEFASILIS
jgi:hypothetical protein